MTRMDTRRVGTVVPLLVAALSSCARPPVQTTPAPTSPRPPAAGMPAAAAGAAGDSARAGGPGAGAAGQPRPYARVITPAAKSRAGMFTTHMIGDRLLFEIPRRELNKDMLLIARTAAAGSQEAIFSGAQGYVRFERLGNRVYLRRVAFNVTADTASAVRTVVEAQRFGPLLAVFNVEAFGRDSAPVIDVTRLYTSSIREITPMENVVPDRSFVQHVAPFAENVEVDAVQTGTAVPAPGPNQGPQAGPPAAARPQTVSAVVHFSLRRLPEQPMMPRLHDPRVGFGSVAAIDYSSREHEASTRRFIRRFRLEKKDPSAAVSEPVKPIVFWIDAGTPEWLVPWVKSGVEAWNVAFEGAGFRNAVQARLAPSAQQDPDFSIYDATRSAIYWRPYTVANATGGQVVDPRTGEILKAEVNMYHNILDLQRRWYFVQASPNDPRARQLPLPDSLMGALVEYVVTHEVGHAIGYPHNMKASSQYPADSIRSASFLRRMGGHVATLMDYSRLNYVAQPEDKVPVELLIPKVGPYDKFAVMWGHKPIPNARTPEDERATLDQWARMQDTVPWLRFTTTDATADPYDLTEAVGDENAVKSSELGLRNLRRVMSYLLPATEKPGRDYSLLEGLYNETVSQWSRYHGHVASIVGGAESQEKLGTGERFTPVSKARQREAVRFLNANAFQVPGWLLDEKILRRIEQEGTVRRIRTAQTRVLNTLLDDSRLNRLVDYEVLAKSPSEAYRISDLLGDVRAGVWNELSTGSPRVDVFRRNLQRAYIEVVDRQLNPRPAAAGQGGGGGGGGGAQAPQPFPGDARALLRGELAELSTLAERAIARTNDPMTRLHLRDVRLEIARILDPSRD